MIFAEKEKYSKLSGVYRITNTVTGQIYIGSTANWFRHRFEQHKSDLVRNRHCNKKLQNSFNKYGPETFIFDVLEEHDGEAAVGLEQWWLNMCNPEFNILKNAKSLLGFKRSPENRKKLKEWHSRPVQASTGERFESAEAAGIYFNIPRSTLNRWLNQKNKPRVKISRSFWYIEGSKHA